MAETCWDLKLNGWPLGRRGRLQQYYPQLQPGRANRSKGVYGKDMSDMQDLHRSPSWHVSTWIRSVDGWEPWCELLKWTKRFPLSSPISLLYRRSMFCTISTSIIIYLHYNPHDIILHAFARPSLQYYLLLRMVEFPFAKSWIPMVGSSSTQSTQGLV